jgi:hypothetical protein
MNRFVALILLIVLAIGIFWLYKEHQATEGAADGAVTVHQTGERLSTPDQDGSNAQSTLPAQSPTYAPAQPLPTAQGTTAVTGSAMPPATDSVAPNPPNGLAFGGTGRFQWYRQGNLTWRVDTHDGAACVAFATMEEWRKPLVYGHGCGNS